MKATIIEIESQRLSDFCYYHGGIRVADEWLDAEGKTLRFLTQDKKHSSYKFTSTKETETRERMNGYAPETKICADNSMHG